MSDHDAFDNNRPHSTTTPGTATGRAAADVFADFTSVRTALAAAPIGVWCYDSAAATLRGSSNFAAICGMPGTLDGSLQGFLAGIHRDDRDGVERALKHALATRSAFRARYRTLPGDGGDERWIEATATVEDGAATRLVGLCYDTTAQVNLENELRQRAKQQEALAQLGERALAEPDLERLLNDVARTVALTLSVDFVKILELLPGGSELLLRAGFGWKSNLVGTILTTTGPNSLGRFTLDSSVPVLIDDFTTEIRFEVGQYLKEHACISGMNVTIAGRDGRAYGILGVCTAEGRQFSAHDLSFLAAVGNLLAGAIQRRQLEARHELMIRDMRHRSGNLFSQLLALFSQTARTSKSVADLAGKYQARVLAMANAHRLITEGGWQSIPIMDLLRVVLGPYVDRTAFDGPNIDLEPDPVFHLSAALHELAANAIKHGSLSRPKGQLELRWAVERTERGMTLAFDWTEKNGPPARRPRKVGFGSRLIDLVIVRQLNGAVTRSYSRKGLEVKMLVPLTHERWPSRASA
ncbi:MAG TPA: HWE histidine kinase domain-containing protein [Xanthobacteraceae bacterium]|nr:HWE histidine kinase domain-containing protein [Xanthobacteraceae bacterium]